MFLQSARPGDSAAAFSASAPTMSANRGHTQTTVITHLSAAPGLSRWDYLGMLAGFLLTLAITLHNSQGRIFWEDEMLGWLLLRDPSWHHMVRAWNLGADGGGFSFYILGRAWFHLFGASRTAFRLFSSTCFGLAFVAIWGALRRFYPSWIVAFATFNTLFFSPPLTMHFLEGRFYGLLVMSTAFAMWLTLVLDETPSPTPGRLYVAAFLVHGLLTTSHVLGVAFSFFVLLATVVLDRLQGRWRVGLYATVAASWLLLIPEKTSILAAGRVGKPHFWTKAPRFWDLLGAYTGYSHEILLAFVTLIPITLLLLQRSPDGLGRSLRASYHQRRAVYIAAGCLLLVPCAFLVEGAVGTWLFTDRYLQPVTVGLAFVSAEVLMLLSDYLVIPGLDRVPPVVLAAVRGAGAAAFAALTLLWVFHHVAMYTPEAPDFTDILTAHLPHDLPVVVEDAFTYTGLIGRQSNSGVQYKFLLDWPWAVSDWSPRLEVTQYHLMENWKAAGYYSNTIENIDTFLRDNPRFLIIDNAGLHADPKVPLEIGNPIAERLSHNPQYEVRKVFTLDRAYRDGVRDTVWLACRGRCGSFPDPIQGPAYCVIYAANTTCCAGQPCMNALPADVRGKIT